MHATPEFALTRDDYRRLQKAVARRLRRQRGGIDVLVWLAKVATWFMIASSVFSYMKMIERLPEEASALEVVAALVLASVLLMACWPVIAMRRGRRLLLADGGWFLRPQQLEFTEEALLNRWSTGLSETRWAGFIGKDEDERNVYLFVDNAAAYVVPRTAVDGFRADFDRLLARIPGG